MNQKNQKQKLKKAVLGILLIAAMVIPMIQAASPGTPAQAKEQAVTYRNHVFTKKLYQKTKKIGFGSDGSQSAEDSKTVKKIYRLLAGMELKEIKNTAEETKTGFVTLVIYKKDGTKKTAYFAGNKMRTGNKYYKITKNNPLDDIRAVYGMNDGNAVVKAVYPKVSPYPDEADYTNADGEFDDKGYSKAYDAWQEDVRARRAITGYADGMDGFMTKSIRQFLSGAEKENRIYSPLNVYMALGMLAEVTDGSSRQQILDLLGSSDMESLRRKAADLWNASYRNDKAVTSILANSLWLNKDVTFHTGTLQSLADHYYASSFKGSMGSDQFNQMLQNWLNEQTGGLLKEQAANEEFSADTVMALASTIYFRARWHHEFLKENTKQDVFHAASGDVTCDFMKKDNMQDTYYWGEKFSAVSQRLEGTGSVWFLLPNENTTAEELLSDSEALEFFVTAEKNSWENQKHAAINLSVPKFDVTSRFELKDGLKKLGVTDVFAPETSDFSPMTEDDKALYVSTADHAARAAVDEEGITAAAYTVIGIDATAALMPEDEIDFVLDRPFLFAVTGSDGLPLFTGIVNQP